MSANHSQPPDQTSSWIFGYGSLIWRPDFNYSQSAVACIQHRVRRFWQGSPDHRGIPGAPGRVVTLIDQPGAVCWGRAFHLPLAERSAILARLDHREIEGYQRLALPLTFDDGTTATGVTWVATADNENFLGPASVNEIAKHVVRSQGPSGTNSEYVLQLARALQQDGHHDEHVSSIAQAVERLTQSGGP